MYGRNVFQILQKKGYPQDKFSYRTTKHPSDEVYQSAQSRRLSSFSRIHTIDRAKHALIENGPVFIALLLYNSGPTLLDSCQPLQSCWRKSVYGNARRSSVAGIVAPSTQETASDRVRPWYVKLLQCVKEYIIKSK